MTKTVLFQTIQFNISTHFKCQKAFHFKLFSLVCEHCLVLFDPLIGPYQVPPIRDIVDQRAMAIKEYFAFSKLPALLKPHHQII